MPEKRVDPDDGMAYTYDELLAYYTGKYKKKVIEAYWENECKPTKRGRVKNDSSKKAPAATKTQTKAKAKAKAGEKAKRERKKSTGTWKILYHAGDFRGRAEFIRLILEDAGISYEESNEKLYGPDGYCDAFRGAGSSEKGLGAGAADNVAADTAPFPVMFPPILHYKPGEGEPEKLEVFVNQVPAIMRYCATRLGYLPRGAVNTAIADEIMLNANDFVAEGRACFHPVDNKESYSKQKEEADKCSKKFAETRLLVWLGHFEKVVKKLCPAADGPLLGRMSFADFVLFHAVDSAEAQFNTDFYDKAWDHAAIPTLKKWKAWVATRPKLAEYRGSNRVKPWSGDSMM